MAGFGGCRLVRALPFALVAASLILAAGCDRPEPPPEDRPAGTRAIPPGGSVPPPGAPEELARPVPVLEEPAAEFPPAEQPAAAAPVSEPPSVRPPLPPLAKEGHPAETGGVEFSPPPRAVVERDTAAGEKGGLENVPAVPTAAAPRGPTPEASIREASREGGTADSTGGAPPPRKEQGGRKTARKTPSPGAAAPAPLDIPVWARDGEELSYKVTFMGVTAGYARLISKGRARVGGHDAYHIQIKAWTTGTLALLFPISETYDYYLDADTLVPLRRDSWLKKVNRPEIVLFDQEKGTVTHWYGDTMEVRKKRQIPPPGFYDGVGATYYFRTRGFGDRSNAIRVFGGRKVYRVSSERAGEETIPYGKGTVDTFLVKPIYKEEGGSGGKPMIGELLVWVSKDPRRVPVKLYASFTKGLEWRLVGELTSGLQ
ncbi:MAG TPA: DUF3108 domain-containing protein [Candidatus Deferrimicrobiaceae bacterium]